MHFSLLHPSRRRVRMAGEAIAEWISKSSGENTFEYILSIDDDDDVEGYRTLAARHGVRLVVGPNRSVVAATNRAAAVSTGDVLIMVSDDFGCPSRWDAELAGIIGERLDCALFVHDGMDARLMTLPILGRALYRRLGYVFYPEYCSLFADDDLTALTRLLGKQIDARHLRFPHRHCSIGANAYDETYQRENSDHAWWSGRRLFERRSAMRFGLRPPSSVAAAHLLALDIAYYVRVAGSWGKERLRDAGILKRRPKVPGLESR